MHLVVKLQQDFCIMINRVWIEFEGLHQSEGSCQNLMRLRPDSHFYEPLEAVPEPVPIAKCQSTCDVCHGGPIERLWTYIEARHSGSCRRLDSDCRASLGLFSLMAHSTLILAARIEISESTSSTFTSISSPGTLMGHGTCALTLNYLQHHFFFKVWSDLDPQFRCH